MIRTTDVRDVCQPHDTNFSLFMCYCLIFCVKGKKETMLLQGRGYTVDTTRERKKSKD